MSTVQFATPISMDGMSLIDAKVHVGFVIKSYRNTWHFQYKDGSKRVMNKKKWVIHGNLRGARASLRKLLESEHHRVKTTLEYIEYTLEGDML